MSATLCGSALVEREPPGTPVARSPLGPSTAPPSNAADDIVHDVEPAAAAVLERLGLPGSADVLRALVTFVIHPEFLHTIPPLATVPVDYVVLPSAFGRRRFKAPYRNVPLPPLPVLSPALAAFLVRPGQEHELAFVDGQNVYGANLFERHEGRRLLRRAVSYLYDALAVDGMDFDIMSYEADGFLISRPRRLGRPSLPAQLRGIIARMGGATEDNEADDEVSARLATFYRYARADVLGPARVSYERRTDLESGLRQRYDVYGDHGPRARLALLCEQDDLVARLLPVIESLAPREQAVALTLMEHALYDPVLQRESDRMSVGGRRVMTFCDPRHLLGRLRGRPAAFCRLEVVSLLKAVNEQLLGGFVAGNAALKVVYRLLVAAVQRALFDAGADPAHEICTLRRWGEFYVAVDGDAVGSDEVARAVRAAFDGARYLIVDWPARPGVRPPSVTLSATCPSPHARRLVVPLITVVMPDAGLTDDPWSIPVERPAGKVAAVARRLAATPVPEVDVAFLADWTLNARDPRRGIPRLVNLLHATDDEVRALARYYEGFMNRKGRRQYRIRRERAALEAYASRLRRLIEGCWR